MMADCAFEPKNIVASSVGVHKNEKSHQLDSHLGGNQTFNDTIYGTAFGQNGLGNKLYGSRGNVSNLTAFVVQNFQNTFVTPDRVVIAATGVENHQEFVDLVNEKMFFTQLPTKSSQRTPATYLGGEVRNLTESSSIHVALAFQGADYKNTLPLLLAQEVLGNSRRSGRIQRNILAKNAFIDGAQAFSTSYEDTGLFGLKVSGSASHVFFVLILGSTSCFSCR
jgi:predicted Zn-dependent peptidase